MNIPEYQEDERIDELLAIVEPKIKVMSDLTLAAEIKELVDRLLSSTDQWTDHVSAAHKAMVDEIERLNTALLRCASNHPGGTA